MLAFATPFWFYSGTLFTEVLTTLCVINMIAHLTGKEMRPGWAGMWLGASILSHVSAILFLPFGLAFVWRRLNIRKSMIFGLGSGLAATLLAVFNWRRFGSIFETGRTVLNPAIMEENGLMYGEFTLPFEGLYGLLVGAGKGAFVYCPIIFFMCVAWRST